MDRALKINYNYIIFLNRMLNKVEDFRHNHNWYQSIGEKLDMVHFRSGHLHAECNPLTGYCQTHYDEYDPHESLTSLAKHLSGNNLSKLFLVGAGILLLHELLKTK